MPVTYRSTCKAYFLRVPVAVEMPFQKGALMVLVSYYRSEHQHYNDLVVAHMSLASSRK